MRKHYLPLVIAVTIISVAGLVITQISWLKESVATAGKQFNDRADRMLESVVKELEQYSDTTIKLVDKSIDEQILFDAVDTNLLDNLIAKYCDYHRLDSAYSYALIRSVDAKIIYQRHSFKSYMDKEAYKSCLSCIWKKEYIHLSVYFPNKVKNIYVGMYIWIILTVVFILIILGVFIFNIHSIIRQKRISEIRNDFINNMTHEFKTPISTISLASEILMRNNEITQERLQKYSGIIYDENKRMQSQVELVLQTALIERKKIKLRCEKTDIHELLKSVVASFSNELTSNPPTFHFNLQSSQPTLVIDPNHIRNVFSNIIDNGIKYSGDNKPIIDIATHDNNDNMLICISDKGMGMTRETQKRIFEKFYRVSTGNIHNVKGFGLGLYYVKLITESHMGSVYVESSLNKGSTFCITLPRI